MKHFIRWLLLIACVMVIGVWVWSLYHVNSLFHKGVKTQGFLMLDGELCWVEADRYSFDPDGWEHVQNPPLPGYRRNGTGITRFRFAGLMLIYIPEKPNYFLKNPTGTDLIIIPIWFLFTPLFLITLRLWYHPIKNWWRGTDRHGFAVEVIEKKEDSA